MTRRVFTNSKTAEAGIYSENSKDTKYDGALERVIKYVPAEIIGLWILAGTLIEENSDGLYFCVFIVLLLCCPWYIHRETSKESEVVAYPQIIIGFIAFPIWALAIGDPCLSWVVDYIYAGFNESSIAAILIIFSAITGLVKQSG
ncbi:MAG: hypothetical protein JXR18_00025 [Neptuniibacter sp.]